MFRLVHTFNGVSHRLTDDVISIYVDIAVPRCSSSSVSSTAAAAGGGKKSSRSCAFRPRKSGGQQISKGIRKRCRFRAGWRHEWIPRSELSALSALMIREVVRGPFSSPRLVGAAPYVLISSNRENGDRLGSKGCTFTGQCPRITRGIPDPWAEYLAYRGFCSKEDRRTVRRDLKLGCKNIYVTSTVWKKLGLPLGQGIPDPWKIPTDEIGWKMKEDSKSRGEKRERPYCEFCKKCQNGEQIPTLPKTKPLNRVVRIPKDCAAPRNPHRREHNFPDFKDRGNFPRIKPICKTFLRTPSTTPSEVEDNRSPGNPRIPPAKLPTVNKNRRGPTKPAIVAKKLPQQTKLIEDGEPVTTYEEKSTAVLAETSLGGENFKIHRDERATQCTFSYREYLLPPCYPCGYFRRDELLQINDFCHRERPTKDASCACEMKEFRRKRVGFRTIRDPANKLEVTKLSCGCVHVSPGAACTTECSGTIYRDPPVSHQEPTTGRESSVSPARKSSDSKKQKMMSRMQRLFNRCRPSKKSVSRSKKVSKEARVDEIPEGGKLICCQCNCPYLKVAVGKDDRSKEEKTRLPKKKGKCQCGRCVARRERRAERRGRTENPVSWVSPRHPQGYERPCGHRVLVESTTIDHHRIALKCHPENPGGNICRKCEVQREYSHGEPRGEAENAPLISTIRFRDDLLKNKEVSVDSKECREPLGEKSSTAGLNSSKGWPFSTVSGAPWQSSDSGENADVSAASRSTVKCTLPMGYLAAPETSLVTSCTFISRIDHSSVMECLKKQKRRGKKGERYKPPLPSAPEIDSTMSRKSPRRTEKWQTSTPTKEGFANHVPPLLDVEDRATNDSTSAGSRKFCIDAQTGSKNGRKKCPSNPDGGSERTENKVKRKSMSDRNARPQSPFTRETNDELEKNLPANDDDDDSVTSAADTSQGKADLRNSEGRSDCLCVDKPEADETTWNSIPGQITTIVYPRKLSTVSSTTNCDLEKLDPKPVTAADDARTADLVPNNSPVDDSSVSENGKPTDEQKDEVTLLSVCPEICIPDYFIGGNCSTERSDSKSSYKGDECSAGEKLDVISGGDVNSRVENSGDESVRLCRKNDRDSIPKGIRQGWMTNTSATENKCYLKYCSQRRSGPCVVSQVGPKQLRVLHPAVSRRENDNRESGKGNVGIAAQNYEFSLDRRAFSSSGKQRNSANIPTSVDPTLKNDPLNFRSTSYYATQAKTKGKANVG